MSLLPVTKHHVQSCQQQPNLTGLKKAKPLSVNAYQHLCKQYAHDEVILLIVLHFEVHYEKNSYMTGSKHLKKHHN
jgi:hypothetical protein